MHYDLLNIDPKSDLYLFDKITKWLQIIRSEHKSLNDLSDYLVEDHKTLLDYGLNLIIHGVESQQVVDRLRFASYSQLCMLSNSIFALACIQYGLKKSTDIEFSRKLKWIASLPLNSDIVKAISNANFNNLEYLSDSYPYKLISDAVNPDTNIMNIEHLKLIEYSIMQLESKCLNIVTHGISALQNGEAVWIWEDFKTSLTKVDCSSVKVSDEYTSPGSLEKLPQSLLTKFSIISLFE
ncbi:MAG: hypothetical protein KC646_10700 [Candidatus Cloacimonetes bacterium]|nr:hypothetical protein [Candidatus Cloacimonadota bacterium]